MMSGARGKIIVMIHKKELRGSIKKLIITHFLVVERLYLYYQIIN
jgi:hypothetical protein